MEESKFTRPAQSTILQHDPRYQWVTVGYVPSYVQIFSSNQQMQTESVIYMNQDQRYLGIISVPYNNKKLCSSLSKIASDLQKSLNLSVNNVRQHLEQICKDIHHHPIFTNTYFCRAIDHPVDQPTHYTISRFEADSYPPVCPTCSTPLSPLRASIILMVQKNQKIYFISVGDFFILHIPSRNKKPNIKTYPDGKHHYIGSKGGVRRILKAKLIHMHVNDQLFVYDRSFDDSFYKIYDDAWLKELIAFEPSELSNTVGLFLRTKVVENENATILSTLYSVINSADWQGAIYAQFAELTPQTDDPKLTQRIEAWRLMYREAQRNLYSWVHRKPAKDDPWKQSTIHQNLINRFLAVDLNQTPEFKQRLNRLLQQWLDMLGQENKSELLTMYKQLLSVFQLTFPAATVVPLVQPTAVSVVVCGKTISAEFNILQRGQANKLQEAIEQQLQHKTIHQRLNGLYKLSIKYGDPYQKWILDCYDVLAYASLQKLLGKITENKLDPALHRELHEFKKMRKQIIDKKGVAPDVLQRNDDVSNILSYILTGCFCGLKQNWLSFLTCLTNAEDAACGVENIPQLKSQLERAIYRYAQERSASLRTEPLTRDSELENQRLERILRKGY